MVFSHKCRLNTRYVLSTVYVLSARITGYGIYTPPEVGPSLAVYDDMFLKEGGAVS